MIKECHFYNTDTGARVLIYDDGEDFVLPMGGGKGGGGGTTTSTITTIVPAKTKQELALDEINLRTAQRQEIQNLQTTALLDPTTALTYLNNPTNKGALAGLEKFDTPEYRNLLIQAQTDKKNERTFNDTIQRQLTSRLTGQAFLTQEEQSALDTLYGQATTAGNESLTQYGREISAQRGLRTNDSPIGNEMTREKGRLELGLQAAKATSSLDLANSQKNFEEGVRQFQEGLQQQAFNNRLSLSTAAPLSFNLANALASQRFQGISQTGGSNTNNNLGFGQIAGGIGGGLVGLGLGLNAVRG